MQKTTTGSIERFVSWCEDRGKRPCEISSILEYHEYQLSFC